MGIREHKLRYPDYSPKSMYGPMPKWLKRFQHRLERQRVREAVQNKETDLPKNFRDIKGRIDYMWY